MSRLPTMTRPLALATTLALLGLSALSADYLSPFSSSRQLRSGGDDGGPAAGSLPESDGRPRGHVCAVGPVPPGWSNSDLLDDIDPFLSAYRERDEYFGKRETNFGGNGLFHSFVLWSVLQRVRPSVIVESGVWNGRTSFLIRKATESWSPKFVRLDPGAKDAWDGRDGIPANTGEVHDFLGKEKFVDFADMDWSTIVADDGDGDLDLSDAMVFFDDHMDQVRRLAEASDAGFGHALFDDNFIAGVGDAFSLKDACEDDVDRREPGEVRYFFNERPQRCDAFHSECTDLSLRGAIAARADVMDRASAYWEGPPLTPIEGVAYQSIRPIINQGRYEGPRKDDWTPDHDAIVVEATKEPLFGTYEEAEERLGMDRNALRGEAGRYMNIAYVRLRQPGGGNKAIQTSVKK